MKPTAKPEISKKWWSSEKPADIKGADLEKALGAAEKALADEKKKSDGPSIKAALAALADLEAAVDKTIKKECDKKKHKDVITVLEKYGGLIKSEKSRLDELEKKAAKGAAASKDGEDEEETEDKIFQQDHLYKMLKLLRSTGKELNFAFGLDTKDPAASKLLLTRKGKPDRLFKMLKSKADFSKRMITYGRAVPDAQNPKMLVFKLADSAGEPPQIQKAGRAFLRSDKNLKFRKLKLVLPGGEVLDDKELDPEDGQQVAGADLDAQRRSAAAAGEIWSKALASATDEIEQLRRELNAFDDPDVASVRDRLSTVLDRYPKLDFQSLSSAKDSDAFSRSLATTRTGLTKWGEALDDAALKQIDDNPFVKTNVVGTFGGALMLIAGELDL